jgi:hypothetical protein
VEPQGQFRACRLESPTADDNWLVALAHHAEADYDRSRFADGQTIVCSMKPTGVSILTGCLIAVSLWFLTLVLMAAIFIAFGQDRIRP